MTLLPAFTETLVIPLDADEVRLRIDKGIEDRKFIGVITGVNFSLSAYLIRPPQFQPVIRGHIESSSRGTLIFLKYELLPATRMLIIFVSILLLVGAAGAVYTGVNLLYATLAVGMVFVFRFVALTNIRLHRDPVRKNLLDILS